MNDDDDLELAHRRTRRRKTIRTALALVAGALVLGSGLYVRYVAPKSGLGEPCQWAMHCRPEAPKCMRVSVDGEGVCSRPCETEADCAEGIRCVSVELDERDERGRPREGGYCFPQSFIDAKKGRTAKPDAGSAPDSWLTVPESPTQLEGEVVLRWQRGGAPGDEKTYLVKGTLLRDARQEGKGRAFIDASGMRLFKVDDERARFTVVALRASGEPIAVDKTDAEDRVADRTCSIWRLTDDKGAVREACVVPGGAFVDPAARTVPAWAHELSVRGVFPLRLRELDKAGRETAVMTVQRLTPRPVDAALFRVPRSYVNGTR